MKSNRVIIGLLMVIVVSLITMNFYFQKSLKMEMAGQFNRHQLLLAQAEASNMQGYLSRVQNELLRIAQSVSMFQLSREQELAFLANAVRKDIRTVKNGIRFLSRDGRILYDQWHIENEDPEMQKHFIDMAGGLCPGEVQTRHTTNRVYLVAPICRSGALEGAVVMFLDIQDIAKEFLGPIKSGIRGYAWMMDGKGNLLFHPAQPDMVGKNLYKTDSSCFQCHRTFDAEKKIIEGTGDFSGRYVAATGEDKVLAFATAVAGDARWIVVVSAPYTEVTSSIRTSMRFHTALIIFILATSGIGASLLFVANRKRIMAEEAAKHEKELEKYAAELERNVADRTRELSEEKEKLNTIVSAMGSGILLLDRGGGIQWINQAMRDIAGHEITGKTIRDMRAGSTVVSSYETGDIKTELIMNLVGRTGRYFQVTTAPVKGEGLSILLVHDVTEMKRLEAQVLHSEKLASLERLTTGIADEIGNPLTSVFSFIQVLLDMEDDEFKKETLETIHLHMSRIADILENLSGFSKMPPLEFRPCKVNGVIDDALSLIQYDKRVQAITIVRDLSPEVPEIRTDSNQLSQVIVNIVLNAADAMPGGGTLTIRTRKRDRAIGIEFEDTGVGIAREDLGRIFDPFYTTKEQGTGLGLAVSFSIVKKLNGDLTVDSEPGKGSRFTISLPADTTA